MSKVEMKVNLVGTLSNTAECLEKMMARLNEIDPDHEFQGEYYAFVLREITTHARGVIEGEHSLSDFAEYYCLQKKQEPYADMYLP